MTTKKHATELHEEHQVWVNKLLLYKDELKVMNNRLAEIARKNTNQEVLAQVEHYQNQFVVQKETIDTLNHKVNEHEAFIQRDISLNPIANDHRLYADSPQLRTEMENFEKIFTHLRNEHAQFLSKYM